MPLFLAQTTSAFTTTLYQSTFPFSSNAVNPFTGLSPKSHFLSYGNEPTKYMKSLIWGQNTSHHARSKSTTTRASLVDSPLLWAGRLCGFFALLKAGLAGSQANPIVSDLGTAGENESGDMGFSHWLRNLQGKLGNEAPGGRNSVSKWHSTKRGTLRRNYRVSSNAEGRCLLKAIASLLSDDDHFTDAASHKGCQIRRESAHGESVCCNNVRALFDELPTPHLVVEITPFPAGELTAKDFSKAEKLERILRSRPSV